jgi:phosphoribosylformylglycinamidine cyclo-ligase
MAHITGGGLIENPPRVVPDGLRLRLDARSWPLPPVMRWLKAAGALDVATLARTFNCGLGMLLFVAAEEVDALLEIMDHQGEAVFRVGEVEAGMAGPTEVVIERAEAAWAADAPPS